MDASSPSRNADGSYSQDFLLWDAQLRMRVAARDYVQAVRLLRMALGDFGNATGHDAVTAVAEHYSKTDPRVAGYLSALIAARQELIDAAVELAEVDPGFDVTPLFPARG